VVLAGTAIGSAKWSCFPGIGRSVSMLRQPPQNSVILPRSSSTLFKMATNAVNKNNFRETGDPQPPPPTDGARPPLLEHCDLKMPEGYLT